jgi:hypothetical protein
MKGNDSAVDALAVFVLPTLGEPFGIKPGFVSSQVSVVVIT